MEGFDISLSEDFSDPCVVVETVGNLYPELEFDESDFGGQQTELADCTTSLPSPLSNAAGFRIDDDDEVDIETVDDGYTMAEKLTAQVIVEDITETPHELPGEAIETEIVFPEMEQNGNLANMHHQNQDEFQMFDMEGIEAEDMNSLFEQFENHDDEKSKDAVIEETVISNEDHMREILELTPAVDMSKTLHRPTHISNQSNDSVFSKNTVNLSLSQTQPRRQQQTHVLHAPTIHKGRGGVSLIDKSSLLSKAIKQQAATKPAVSLVGKNAKVIQIGQPGLSKQPLTVPVKLAGTGKSSQLAQLVVRQPDGTVQLGKSGSGKSIIIRSTQKPSPLPGGKTHIGQPQLAKYKLQTAVKNELSSGLPISSVNLNAVKTEVKSAGFDKLNIFNSNNVKLHDPLKLNNTAETGDLEVPSTKVADPHSLMTFPQTVQPRDTPSMEHTTITASTDLSYNGEKSEDIMWVDTDGMSTDISTEVVTSECSNIDTGWMKAETNIIYGAASMSGYSNNPVVDLGIDNNIESVQGSTATGLEGSSAADNISVAGEEVVLDNTLPDVSETVELGTDAIVYGEEQILETTVVYEEVEIPTTRSTEPSQRMKQEPMDQLTAESLPMRRPPWMNDSAQNSRPSSHLSSRPPSRNDSRGQSSTSSRNASRRSSPKREWRRSPSPEEMLLDKIPGYLSALSSCTGGPSMDDSALTAASSILRDGQSVIMDRDPSPVRENNTEALADYNRLPSYLNSYNSTEPKKIKENGNGSQEKKNKKSKKKHKKKSKEKCRPHRRQRNSSSEDSSLSEDDERVCGYKQNKKPRRYRTPSVDSQSSDLTSSDEEEECRRDNYKRRRRSRSRSPLPRKRSLTPQRSRSRYSNYSRSRSRSYSHSSGRSYHSSSYKRDRNRRKRYRSRSCSYTSYSSRSRSRSSGRSYGRDNRRRKGYSRRERYRNKRSPERSLSPRRTETREKKEAHDRAMAERRVVYVGGIPDGFAPSDLRRRFDCFGDIETTSVHFRQKGDNYGFVTYLRTESAKRAIQDGNKTPGRKFNLCYGGRRTFCKTDYADLDGCTAVKEEWAINERKREDPADDFDALLRQTLKKIKS